MNCVIIEDEMPAMRVLEEYVEKTPQLNLIGKFRNPIEALPFISDKRPCILLLDINMPDLSGHELLDSLAYNPYVIFTTAYAEYALKSFEYITVDYLLKPIRFDRFLKAINKASLLFPANEQKTQARNVTYCFLKSGHETIKLPYKNLLYLEASRNYVYYHTAGRKIVIKQSLKEALSTLPTSLFIRIHKSYAINLEHIRSLSYDTVNLATVKLPIGRNYREDLKQAIK